jgi:hypothetical protein
VFIDPAFAGVAEERTSGTVCGFNNLIDPRIVFGKERVADLSCSATALE